MKIFNQIPSQKIFRCTKQELYEKALLIYVNRNTYSSQPDNIVKRAKESGYQTNTLRSIVSACRNRRQLLLLGANALWYRHPIHAIKFHFLAHKLANEMRDIFRVLYFNSPDDAFRSEFIDDLSDYTHGARFLSSDYFEDLKIAHAQEI